MKTCKTCKKEFDEPYVNCTSCRKKRATYMNEYYHRERKKTPKDYTKDCKTCGKIFSTGNVRGSHAYKHCQECRPIMKKKWKKGSRPPYDPVKAREKYLKYKKPKPIHKEKCPTCDATFLNEKDDNGHGGYKKYCSIECRPDKVKARMLREKRRKEGKKCEWCGEHICFENATERRLKMYKNVRFCSTKCTNDNRMSDPQKRIRSRVSGMIRRVLVDMNRREAKSTFYVLGYSLSELVSHLEDRFQKPKWNGFEWVENTKDYSWENISEWHLDHIRPVSSFNFTTTDCEDFKKCWALDNLQPLWAADNLNKGNKWNGEVNA